MKILLVCSAGMSTSLLVERMLASAKERPIADTVIYGKDADAIMLGPQVRFQEDHIRSLFDKTKPIAVIDMKDYGMMNGKKVLQDALDLIESKK